MVRIKDLPEGDRPREKLIKYGPDKLTNEELLALILGSVMELLLLVTFTPIHPRDLLRR